MKRHRDLQFAEAKPHIHRKSHKGHARGDNDEHDTPISQQKEGKTYKGIDDRIYNPNNTLKYKLLICTDDGVKNTADQSDRNISDQDQHEDPGFRQLCFRQTGAEDLPWEKGQRRSA